MAAGGKRLGSGRPRTREKYSGPVNKAEKQIVDRLPEIVQEQIRIGLGGYERVEEKWIPSAMATIGAGQFVTKAFPEIPDDELVMVERKRSIADGDKAALQYLINRILGSPVQKSEVTGEDGKDLVIKVVYADRPIDPYQTT